MKFCPECGSKLTEGAKFCGSCGKKLACVETSNFDVEKFCKEIIDVPEEGIYKEKITTPEIFYKIKEAADSGVGIAAYVMSWLDGFKLNDKELLPYDPDVSVKYLFKAAEAGCPYAQGQLGNNLWCGIEESTDYDEGEHPDSFSWIEKAANQKNVLALHRASYAYLDGDYGQKADWDKALECFKTIIAEKDAEPWNEEWIERATGYLRYFPQIMKGNTEAMRDLGEWLKEREGEWNWSYGLGGEIEESAFWLKKAKATSDEDEDEDVGVENEEAQLEEEFDEEDFDETGFGDDDIEED